MAGTRPALDGMGASELRRGTRGRGVLHVSATRVLQLRGWPGLDGWKALVEPPPTKALARRVGLVLIAAGEAGAGVDRFGLGAFLVVRGKAVLSGGVIVPDDLGSRSPDVLAAVRAWAKAEPLDTPLGKQPWRVVSLREFCDPRATVDESPWAFGPRAYSGAGPVIGADLGHSLGLMAEHVVERTGRNAGSWELWLPGWGIRHRAGNVAKASPNRPALRLSVRRAGWSVEFAPCERHFGKRVGGRAWRGEFIDVLSLAYGFDADRAGGFVEHARNFGLGANTLPVCVALDVSGAADVAGAARSIHALAIALDGHAARWFTQPRERAEGVRRVDIARLQSPAALAALVPQRFRVTAPLGKFTLDDAEHRAWAEAFHGGWCEGDERLWGLPFFAANLDVSSAYPLCAYHLGWWKMLLADKLRHQDVTEPLRRLCERAVRDPLAVLDPRVWRRFGITLVEVVPDGERFPVGVEDDKRPDGRSETVPVFSPERPLFYAWPDVLAAAVMSGRVPDIRRATQLVPVGRQAGLRSRVPVCPGLVLDLDTDPVLGFVARRRRAKAAGDTVLSANLHAVVNSLVFGNFSRFDPIRQKAGRSWKLSERPGPWSFLPIAGSVQAGSRLLLGVLDRMVADLGGIVAYRDTDSSVIPASEDGGELALPDGTSVHALSWQEVGDVIGAFGQLAPDADWPVWKVERGERDAALRSVIFGPKRHVEYMLGAGGPELTEWTEAGLGGMWADPAAMQGRCAEGGRAWSKAAVMREVIYAETRARCDKDAVTGPVPWDAPGASPFPTLRRLIVTVPETLASLPEALGARVGTRYLDGIGGGLGGQGAGAVALDPGGSLDGWEQLTWLARKTGQRVAVSTDPMRYDAAQLEALSARAHRYARRPRGDEIAEVHVDPDAIVRMGRVSGVIDAQEEGIPGELRARRTAYDDANRLAVVQRLAKAHGPRRFARRAGLPLKVAERAALGQPISKGNTARALRALRVDDGTARCCALDGCDHLVYRPNAIYCDCASHKSHRSVAQKRRQRARRPTASPARPGPRTERKHL